MTLLDKVKSLLGLEPSRPEPSDDRDVGVTVEHEPDEEEAGVEADEAEEPETDEQEIEEPDTDEPEAKAEEAEETEPESEAEEAEAETDEAEYSEDDLEDVKGIGPSYADRLREAGIETVADLADADAETLAAESDVPEGRLEEWIERAQNR